MDKPQSKTTGIHQDCAMREVLELIGDKWSLLILYSLYEKTLRFNELKSTVAHISQRVLTQRLRSLERDGFVLRTVHPVSPPKVEYKLTELGQSIFPALSTLAQWAQQTHGQIQHNRQQYDRQE